MNRKYEYLDQINFPSDLKKIPESKLQKVSDELREEMIEANGGKEPDEPIPTVMTVLMEKGTWLHIGIRDFREFILEIQPDDEEIEEDTDEQISVIPRELMTEKDFSCVAIKRAAKRKLALSMFNFMSKYELIPHNAAVMSSEFVVKGSPGRGWTLSKEFVYAIIDGRACLQLSLQNGITASATDTANVNERGRGPSTKMSTSAKTSASLQTLASMGGTIAVGMKTGPDDPNDKWWAYKDAKEVAFKRKEMPVLRMEAGTLIALVEEHFQVGNDRLTSDSTEQNIATIFLPNISTVSNNHALDTNSSVFNNGSNKGTASNVPYECPYTIRFTNETSDIFSNPT